MNDLATFGDLLLRLAVAAGAGGLLGFEREIRGRWAGLRTHMLVAMGAAAFMAASAQISGDTAPEISRVMQGVAAGIGFIGAGTILQLSDRLQVKGLTTAGSIWLAAALGAAAGLQLYALAAAGTLIAILVLVLLRPLDKWFERRRAKDSL